jgi:hypothetical protein
MQKSIDATFGKFIESAIKKISDSKIIFSHNTAKKKLTNAIASFAPEVSASEVIVLIDDTFFGGAKEGLIITNKSLYSKEVLETPYHILISEIHKFEYMNNSLSSRYFVINNKKLIRACCTSPDSSQIFAELFTNLLENIKKIN